MLQQSEQNSSYDLHATEVHEHAHTRTQLLSGTLFSERSIPLGKLAEEYDEVSAKIPRKSSTFSTSLKKKSESDELCNHFPAEILV